MPGLRVITPGMRTIVVDHGFRGGRGQGVPGCGALDRRGLALLNGLLGNASGMAALEWALVPPVLRAEGGAVRVAFGNGAVGEVRGTATRPVRAWEGITLAEGEELHLSALPPVATGLVAVAGGPDVPVVLDSRSTMLPAGFGGVEGRVLREGDLLPCLPAPAAGPSVLTPPPAPGGPIRIVAGPQTDAFAPEALSRLVSEPWRVTSQADRMGLRLEGPGLPFAPGQGPDIVSDGIVPGAMQVPGNGQPILLLADAQTTGGYAKIACVIRADLWRLAHVLPGADLRFDLVSVAEAEAAARHEAEVIAAALATLRPAGGGVDLAAANLAGEAVDAARPDHFPGQIEGDNTCA